MQEKTNIDELIKRFEQDEQELDEYQDEEYLDENRPFTYKDIGAAVSGRNYGRSCLVDFQKLEESVVAANKAVSDFSTSIPDWIIEEVNGYRFPVRNYTQSTRLCEKCGIDIRIGDRVGTIAEYPDDFTQTVCGKCYDKHHQTENF